MRGRFLARLGLELAPGGVYDCRDGCNETPVEIAPGEPGLDHKVDDLSRGEVGELPFEAPADFYPDLALRFGNQHNDAVVPAFLPRFPGLRHLDAESPPGFHPGD